MQRLRRCASVARALRGASSRAYKPSDAQVRLTASVCIEATCYLLHALQRDGHVATERLAHTSDARPLSQAGGANVQALQGAARGFSAAPDVAPADDDPRPVEMKGVSMSGKPLYLDMQARSPGACRRRHLLGVPARVGPLRRA